jgi:hypothetical protein
MKRRCGGSDESISTADDRGDPMAVRTIVAAINGPGAREFLRRAVETAE